MDSWYVLHVLTGKELEVKNIAKKNGFKAFAPRRILREQKNGVWKNVERILIPGYVFIQTEMTSDNYYKIEAIPGIINILRGASAHPEPVLENEMKVIFGLTRDSDLVGISDIYYEGQNIKVFSGPLEGLEGNIVKVDKRQFRAKVKFIVAGNEKIVELGINVLNKA